MDCAKFLKSVTYWPTLSKIRVELVKKTTLYLFLTDEDKDKDEDKDNDKDNDKDSRTCVERV